MCIGWLTAGCVDQHRAVLLRDSQPPRIVTPDTPQTLPERSTSLRAMGGYTVHTGENPGAALEDEPTFHVRRPWGYGRVGHGVYDGLEMSLEGWFGRYDVNSPLCVNVQGYREGFRTPQRGTRFGLKLSPQATRRFLGIKAGMGVNDSKLGTYVGPDLGISLGWANPWVTPFFSLNLLGSVPVTGSRRTLIDCNDGDSIRVDYEPVRGVLLESTVGARFQVRERRQGRMWTGFRFYVAASFMQAALRGWTLFGGIELVFGPSPEWPQRAKR